MKPQFTMTPLSKLQKAGLMMMARQAYQAAVTRRAVDPQETDFDTWRRLQQVEAGAPESIRQANQGHYLAIRGAFWVVLGNLEQGFHDFLASGPQNEARRQMAWRLAGQVSALADGIAGKHDSALLNEAVRAGSGGLEPIKIERMSPAEAARQAWSYAQSIARDKFRGRGLDSLQAADLEQLGFTVVNRTTAMRGKGDSSRRNKSQRRRRHDSAEAPEEIDRISTAVSMLPSARTEADVGQF
jgi:hypothetical protein